MNVYDSFLCHHGVKGQEWGVRNGPPYPLKGGTYTDNSKHKTYKESRFFKNSRNNKKHFDKTISKGTVLQTLSFDKDRTTKGDMFYAAYTPVDKRSYETIFDGTIDEDVLDTNGNVIGKGSFYRYKIKNEAIKDIKVASEDSGVDAFVELYTSDNDFYNFVVDKNRMESYGRKSLQEYSEYRKATKILRKLRDNYVPDKKDLKYVYSYFNNVIAFDGAGDEKKEKDNLRQRAKFFKSLKEKGYSAALDTYNGLHDGDNNQAPIIVFDKEAIVLQSAERKVKSIEPINNTVKLGKYVVGM